MLGAIIGDMVGSIYEFHNHRSKEFPFFSDDCWPTDDSIMTIALAKAILETDGKAEGLSKQAVKWMRKIGQQYPSCGYGGRFYDWMFSEHPQPYGSYGNGAAMRVSACGWAANSIDEAKELAYAVTRVTHDHEEGIWGAEAVACCIYLARSGCSKENIRRFVEDNYYDLDFTLDEIRPRYHFSESCQGTVPQAIEAFLESESFEDAIRNAMERNEHTFDTFIEGPCNRGALVAAKNAANNWGHPYNPLTLYGKPGTGKTHLLKVQLDESISKAISDTLIYARERIKQSLIQSSLSGDADSRIAGMLLTAMGETTPETSATVNVIIQGDSDAYSV